MGPAISVTDDDTGPTTPTSDGSLSRRCASAPASAVWSYTLLGSIVNDDPCFALKASSATRAQFICAGWVESAEPADAITPIIPVHDSPGIGASAARAAGPLDRQAAIT